MSNEILDSADFIEITLKHLIRDPAVYQKAKELKLKADDFLSSELAGIRLYKELADVALTIGHPPIDRKIVLLHLKEKLKSGSLQDHSVEDIGKLIDWIFSSDLNAVYVNDRLKDFIRRRRLVKAHIDNADDPESVLTEMSKVAVDLNQTEASTKTRTFKPFETIVTRPEFSGLQTGFARIDKVIGGLGFGEYGLIIGHSSSGKTAVAASIMLENAQMNNKVLYLSAEEPGENICDRGYSKQFKIGYTALHQGAEAAKLELTAAMSELPEEERRPLIENLQIEDVRHLAPINKDMVITILEKKAKEGFLPDLVIIDQMDYQEPIGKYDQKWQRYEAVSMENDYLSQYLIAGHKPFGLWVLHQASGKMSRTYTNAEISGFKGVIRPADICLCIGRESIADPVAKLFSLKTRHTDSFDIDYQFNGEFMSFENLEDNKNPHKKVDETKKKEKQFRKQGSDSENADSSENAFSHQ